MKPTPKKTEEIARAERALLTAAMKLRNVMRDPDKTYARYSKAVGDVANAGDRLAAARSKKP